MNELIEEITTEARHLGFILSGVTHPGTPDHLDHYFDWLNSGFHGGMNYMATEKAKSYRVSPGLIMPGCRSIIVLALPYDSPKSAISPDPQGEYGRIAAYAWGRDYHLEINKRLGELGQNITRMCGSDTQFKICTDTSPILERELGQRAGLGWIGKNTCLINPHLGSYFFLTEIILNIKLDFNAPFMKDCCGSCQRCIDACPTGALLPNRMLDSRRCISYLTIENKATIPEELRSYLGNWIFGCDICQEVCPWNIRFSPLHGDPAFAPLCHTPFLELSNDLELTEEEFEQKFNQSPIQRAHRRGYLRNLINAISNSSDRRSIASLMRLSAKETDPLLQEMVDYAIACLQIH
jgi:epoxyqueuosine reductase